MGVRLVASFRRGTSTIFAALPQAELLVSPRPPFFLPKQPVNPRKRKAPIFSSKSQTGQCSRGSIVMQQTRSGIKLLAYIQRIDPVEVASLTQEQLDQLDAYLAYVREAPDDTDLIAARPCWCLPRSR